MPDLAESLPAVSSDGRTYVFRLRQGIRWSTGQPLTGADVRRGLERTVAARVWALYAGIAGAARCSPRRCDLSEGIQWDAATRLVTIKLTEPDPEFLYKLAVLGAVAAPAGTPIGPVDRPIPATGPYVVTQDDASRLELARNPQFHQWSAAAQPAGFPDRIIASVHADASPGQPWTVPAADWVTTNSVPDPAALRDRYGDRVRDVAELATAYLFLDTSRPPFDSDDARRAVAFALNRASLAATWPNPGPATCQILPPGIPGYQPYCPFTLPGDVPGQWSAPDLTAAQRLVQRSHTGGDAVRIMAPAGMTAMQQVADTMRAIGFRADVVNVPPPAYFARLAGGVGRYEAGFFAWGADYPAASNFLQTQLACDQRARDGGSNYSEFCDPTLDRMMDTAARLQVTSPAAAIVRWATVERRAVDSAALIGIVNPRHLEIVSTRLGHAETNLVTGALFDQAWVR